MFSFSVKVFPLKNPSGKLVGFASVIVDDVLKVDGFKIFDGANGLFVAPPSREGTQNGEKKYFDQVWFEGEGGNSVKEEIYGAMVEEYQRQGAGTSRQAAAKAQAEAQKPEAQKPEDQKPEKRSYARPAW